MSKLAKQGMIIDNLVMTYIDHSDIHGQGLFAANAVRKGQVLGTLDGQSVPRDLIKRVIRTLPCHNTVAQSSCSLFFEWNALDSGCLLVRPYRTKYSYINHSRTPNIEVSGNQIVTLRDIRINEELTLDYRNEPLPDDYLAEHGATYL